MHNATFTADVLDKYQKVRALAERGIDGERVSAQRIMEKLERDNPGIRAYVDRMNASANAGRARGGPTPTSPDWSKVAEQAADFLNGVFRDIQREAEQRAKRGNTAPAAEEEEDGIDEEDEDLIDEVFTITPNVTRTGKVTLKIEIDPDGIEALMSACDDNEDDVWIILQGVGARVADELGEMILGDDEDEDED